MEGFESTARVWVAGEEAAAICTRRVSRAQRSLPPDLWASLQALVQQQGVTPFVAVLSGWAILLGRWYALEELLVRARGVGSDTHEAHIRLLLEDDLSVEQFLKHTSLEALRARIDETGVAQSIDLRKPPRNPALDFVMGLNDLPAAFAVSQQDAAFALLADSPFGNDTERGTLSLSLSNASRGPVMTLDHSGSVDDESLLGRMLASLEVVLRSMATDARQVISALPLLTAAEQARVLEILNDTAAVWPHDSLIHQLIERQVEASPQATALRFERQSLTFRELNRRANQLAHYLRQRGVGPEQRVAVCVERGFDMIVALLGILKAGGVYVPLDPSYPAARLTSLLTDAEPRVVLSHERLRGVLPPSTAEVIALDSAWPEIAGGPITNLDPKSLGLASSHLAYIIYTSGSTGEPKGVAAEHRSMVNRIAAQETIAPFSEDDICCHKTSLGFVDSIFEALGPLSYGRPLVLAPDAAVKDVEQLALLVAREQVTRLVTVPSWARFMLESEQARRAVQSLRNWTLSGEELHGELLRQLHRALPNCVFTNLYGSSEVAADVTYHVSRHFAGGRVPIGRPIPNARVYVLGRDRCPVPPGAIGEIYVGGVAVARGYLNRPGLTAERFCADPFSTDESARLYRTGDRGRWRSDGLLEYLGREDHQVKIRGQRIELGEIESQLTHREDVKEAVVIAREDTPGEKRLVAYVVGDRDSASRAETDRDDLRSEIVNEWETLWRETYGTQERTPGPSFVGWNSSYTGKPIPLEEMSEWLNCTVERIRKLQPKNVLEIGCGIGLVLQHLAPECATYVGTDVEPSALNQLRRWMGGRPELRHVELLHKPAIDVTGIPPHSFDTVILNSVVQYFPDVEYLLGVLKAASRLVVSGGRIFIGDIRSLGLLSTFHSAVELDKATPTLRVGQLRRRISRAVAQEKELVIDPQLFRSLPGRVSGIRAAEVHLKRGRAANELTRYRYDVVLHIGEGCAAHPAYEDLEWHKDVSSVGEIESFLEERRALVLLLREVPNSRLAMEIAAQRLIETSDEASTAGHLQSALRARVHEGVEPEFLWKLGEAHGYEVSVSWSSQGPQGSMDVRFLDAAAVGRLPQVHRAPPEPVKSWCVYATEPLESSFRRQLVPKLREYLRERLPEYMLPSAWVVLKQLPLTPSGKVDRRALPPPASRPEDLGEYVPPRTELEQTLAEVWAQVLRIDQVGVHDNFFELGGHSLLIVQMLEQLRRKGFVTEARRVFESPTLADLAQAITREATGLIDIPPSLIPAGCEQITPEMLPLVALEPEHIARILQAAGGASAIQDIYPLAPLQEGILFHHLLNEQSGDTHVRVLLLELASEEKLQELIRALQTAVDRHDILRTAVLWEDLPRPLQVVYRRALLPVHPFTLDANRDLLEQLRERVRTECHRLDLRQAPLMRLQVAAEPRGPRRYAVLRTHHLVCDNESIDILLTEVAAYLQGSAHLLAEAVPYRNHVAQALALAARNDAEAFFREKLADIDEPTAPFGLLDVHGDAARIEEASDTIDVSLAQRARNRAR